MKIGDYSNSGDYTKMEDYSHNIKYEEEMDDRHKISRIVDYRKPVN